MFDACDRNAHHDSDPTDVDTDVNSIDPTDWKRAHDHLLRLARTQHGLDFEIGRSMLFALRSSAHLQLGFATFGEDGERLLGCSPRMIHDRLRVAEALETLRAAHGRTLREVEQRVAGRAAGDRPDDPADPARQKHVLRFEVTAETLATFRTMMAEVKRAASEPLDDDAALLLVAREVLGGPTDEGRAGYQVLLAVCPTCGRGDQEANGERVQVSAEAVEMARCDAQVLSEATHVGARPRATQTIPPAVRRLVLRRDSGCCRVPGCQHTRFVDVHHLDPRAEGGGHDPANLATLCSAHHRAVHRGEIVASGPATAVRFRHADGTPYGGAVDPTAAKTSARLFSALRNLGFREKESRKALDAIATHVGEREPLEVLLPRALAVIAPVETH